MFVIILVSTGLMCGVFLQVNGQCTSPGCKGSSGGTDEMTDESQRNYDQGIKTARLALGLLRTSLLATIEKNYKLLQSIVQRMDRMDDIYVSAKYKVCPPGFQFLPGADGCFKVLFNPVNWAKAVDECKTLQPGAHLTAITSAAKQAAIKGFLENELSRSSVCDFLDNTWIGPTGSVWISAQRQDPSRCDSNFVWRPVPSVEIPFGYTNWMQVDERGPQPDCWSRNESCAQIYKTENYAWNDVNCESQVCPLCEI